MQDQAMPQKSWFGRNWKWVVPVGCLTPILVCGGFFTLIFGAVFGMLGLNRLPQWYHSLFNSERFKAVTDDKFFISIEARDPKYDAETTRALLEGAGATVVEEVED